MDLAHLQQFRVGHGTVDAGLMISMPSFIHGLKCGQCSLKTIKMAQS